MSAHTVLFILLLLMLPLYILRVRLYLQVRRLRLNNSERLIELRDRAEELLVLARAIEDAQPPQAPAVPPNNTHAGA
jgi:hypothetical protein